MISSIGFIPNNQEINSLVEFSPDEFVKQKLDYLQIPYIPKSEDKDENFTTLEEVENFPVIKNTDKILFATSNTENISNVAFYGYDQDELFFHHDIFVFSTILDGCYLTGTSVALATFEPNIFIYDFMVDLPVLPQALLIGHTDVVTGLKNKEGRMISSSEDKTMIEWDISKLVPKKTIDCQVGIQRFDFEDSNFVFGSDTYININDENISLDFELEQLKINKNTVYVTDSNGNIILFDIRNPSKPLYSEKIHEGEIFDVCIADDWIVTTSSDNVIKLLKYDEGQLKCKRIIEKESTVYALGFDGEDVFCGDEEDYVFAVKLE